MVGVAAVAGLVLGACQGEPEPPSFTQPVVLGGVSVAAETLERGKHVYQQFCVHCHGADGAGQGPAGRALDPPPRDFRTGVFMVASPPGDRLPTDAQLLRLVEKGRIERGMPAFPMVPPDDRMAVVHYIKTFSPRWRAADAAAP